MPCTVAIVTPENAPCAVEGNQVIGQQVVGILVQDMAGAPPLLTSLANVQAALAATGADTLFILGNLAAATVPESADVLLDGNNTPYGIPEITQRTRTLASELQYLTKPQLVVADALGARGGTVRHWEYDNLNNIQGPFENSGIRVGILRRAGIGGDKNRKALTVTTVLPLTGEPPFLTAPVPGINLLQNA